MELRSKLLISKLCLAILPAAAIAGAVLWQSTNAFRKSAELSEAGFRENSQAAREALIQAGLTDLRHLAENVYSLCHAQQELLQEKVRYDLNVAREILRKHGEPAFNAIDTVSWNAVNQYTKALTEYMLPKMEIDGVWLGQNRDPGTESLVVDEVKSLIGGTCTIFQRMNADGDMLRVATNVIASSGDRAIGTFIPAVNPDGTPNPVVSTLLKGETFYGRAYVVNAWYITAYEPIRNTANEVVGALYVGVKEEKTHTLRKAIMDVKVGKTGYIYVLNAKGSTRGHYVVSKDGKRDGEDIWGVKDANGQFCIQDICQKALELKPGEVSQYTYFWKNASDPAPREKVAMLAYFEPWDWVIGVSVPLDEFYDVVNDMETRAEETLASARQAQAAATSHVVWWCIVLGAITLVVCTAVALFVTRGITKPIGRIIRGLDDGADQVSSASAQVASASQQLAAGASDQASSLEETSSALEQMAAMTRTNAEHARAANNLSDQAKAAAQGGDRTMEQLNIAMAGINVSSNQISKIIKVIEEIAFQTNLLALNAAVEAARAGEHGKGFAVVADEVRNLAQRAAHASGEITTLIEDSVIKVREGTEVASAVAVALGGIVADVTKVADLIAGISTASEEQAQGVDQVNSAVSQMSHVTQRNAAGAEESASAAEQMAAQAESVKSMVRELASLVGASDSTAEARTSTLDTHEPVVQPEPAQHSDSTARVRGSSNEA